MFIAVCIICLKPKQMLMRPARGKVARLIRSVLKQRLCSSGATMALNLIAHSYGNTHLVEGDEVRFQLLTTMPILSPGIYWEAGLGQRRLPLLLMQMVASI